MFKVVKRELYGGDNYFPGWAVVDADGERVYPEHNSNTRVFPLFWEICETLNRSPLSYHMLRLDGLSRFEAARHILDRTE